MAFLDAKLGRAARIRGSNLMFLKDWLDALPEGVEVSDSGRNLTAKLNDTLSAVISIRFESTTISIKLSPASYEVEFPTSYPGISAYLDTSDQSHRYLKGLGGTKHEIRENRIVYLFETINQEDVLDVLNTLKEAIVKAMQARASPLTPDQAQPASAATPARVQASVEFSDTLTALEGFTPQELQHIYLEALQQLNMQLINTCKVESQADGASYKVTIFTFGSPPHPLDGLLIEDKENSAVFIEFDGRTHRYRTESALYAEIYPGFTITIRGHAEMTSLWLALTAQLNQFRINNIARYALDFSDEAMRDKFAGPIGRWRRP
jgi:hypothetical protein